MFDALTRLFFVFEELSVKPFSGRFWVTQTVKNIIRTKRHVNVLPGEYEEKDTGSGNIIIR